VLIDSYSESNYSSKTNIDELHPATTDYKVSACGQSFTLSGNYVLASCKFYLKPANNSGSLTARLYAATGTVGSTAIPTGNALVSSNEVDLSSEPYSWVLFDFTFPTPYIMSDNTDYCIVVEATDGFGINDWIEFALDSSSPTHPGNSVFYGGSSETWTASALSDSCFYIYGYVSKNLISRITVNPAFSSTNLLCQLTVFRSENEKNLVSQVTVLQMDSKNLKSRVTVLQADFKNLVCQIDVDIMNTIDLICRILVYKTSSTNLVSQTTVLHISSKSIVCRLSVLSQANTSLLCQVTVYADWWRCCDKSTSWTLVPDKIETR